MVAIRAITELEEEGTGCLAIDGFRVGHGGCREVEVVLWDGLLVVHRSLVGRRHESF